jgi:hypothetical protein
MSKSFKKTCDRGCNTEIEMSNKEGAWRPINLDGSPHECQAKLRPEPKPTHEQDKPVQEQTEISKQNEQKIKNGNNTLPKIKHKETWLDIVGINFVVGETRESHIKLRILASIADSLERLSDAYESQLKY